MKAFIVVLHYETRATGTHDGISFLRCQKALMAQLELGPNIARNAALTENVFMMVVCIELRIPLFVVGKPGSSKSLAKTVVADKMQGENSKSELFKTFKQVRFKVQFTSPMNPEKTRICICAAAIREPLSTVGIPSFLIYI